MRALSNIFGLQRLMLLRRICTVLQTERKATEVTDTTPMRAHATSANQSLSKSTTILYLGRSLRCVHERIRSHPIFLIQKWSSGTHGLVIVSRISIRSSTSLLLKLTVLLMGLPGNNTFLRITAPSLLIFCRDFYPDVLYRSDH